MANQHNWRNTTGLPSLGPAPDDAAWAFGFANPISPGLVPGDPNDTLVAAALPLTPGPFLPPLDPPSGRQIVFIEGNVPDAQLLAAGVAPGVQAVILDPGQNGVQQIADYLQQHDTRDLDAISIVADGADGELQLGNTLLNASNVAGYQPQLAAIGTALKPGGDLLLYGCDVAQNSAGDAFLRDLAGATGVSNIAAASHVVGAAAEGGSFNLDVDLGSAAAATGPFTAAAVAAYPDSLGVASNLVWYITESSTTSQTGVYTVDVNGGAAATNPNDISSTPSAPYSTVDGLAIDPSAGVYFVANFLPTGPFGDTNQILEGNISGGTPSVIYTSGNSGGDAIVGLAFDQLNGLLYFAVTDVNIPGSNTTTGIYTISALGTGTRTATELVNLGSGVQAPTDIAIDTTNNLLFYTDGVPGLTNVEEVGVANLSTGAVINGDLVSYSASGNVEPYGIAVNPATDTLYWTTVNFTANSGNAIYSATYSTGASANLSGTQTLATTSQGQVPIGIALDVPANGYYVDTSTGISNDTTANEVLFGSSLTTPETLTDVYNVPKQNSGTETLPTEGIVVEVQPVVTASGAVNFVHGQSAVTIDPGATVSDAEGYYLASATVGIASGLGAGDTLNFTNQNGITGSFSSGTLTLTGITTAAIYQTALDSVTFSTTNATDGTARSIDWTVSDGNVSSATETSTVHVDVPAMVTAGATKTFHGGDSPVALDSGLVVTDASTNTLIGASVTIVSPISADRLNFSNQHGISGSAYNTSTGVLTLSGTASVANYQQALESITYSVSPTNSDPTGGGGHTSRTIDWTVNDGTLSSNIATSTLDTTHTAPVVAAGGSVAYAEIGPPVTLDAGVIVSDVDSLGILSSATVSVSSGFLNGDTLSLTNQNGISGTYDSGSGALTLSGTASIADYNAALQSITYSFSGDPTDNGNDKSRTISWVANDGVDSSATAHSSLTTSVCYCAGTHIATERGEVPVEALCKGDRVITHSGDVQPITWIGQRRLDVTRHPDPRLAQPIRIRRAAVAENLPHRDLLVSPDHAVFLDGLLIPARLLANAMTIAQDTLVRSVHYFHVELDNHAVLLAEGLGSESYLDTGNRSFFANGQPATTLHPRGDGADDQRRRVAASCAPFADDAARVEPVWRRLAERARQLGFDQPHATTSVDPALRILAGGRALQPLSRENDRYVFLVPPSDGDIRLISRVAAPCELQPWVEDRRRLGVMVRRVVLRCGAETVDFALDDPRLATGWWDVERGGASMWRWTNGDARFPAALIEGRRAPFTLELEIGAMTDYPLQAAA